MACGKKLCYGLATFVGLAMVIIGGAILGAFPNIMEMKIQESLSLKPDSEAANRFIKSPVANYMRFYLFHVENMDDVNKNNAKPVLKEKGPFVYRQEKEKINLKWNEDIGTLSYQEMTNYFFEPSMSTGSLEDPINHLNIVPIGLRYNEVVKTLASFCNKKNVEEYMKEFKSELIITHTVDELLFGGYHFPSQLPNIPCMIDISTFCEGMGCSKTGYFSDRNGSQSLTSEYEVFTGVNTMDNYGMLVSYERKRDLTFWHDRPCNAINGSDGKQFPPGVDKEKDLYVFSSEICRSMKFEYEKDVTVEKIEAHRFLVPEYVFEDPNKDKNNMCFCRKGYNSPCPSKKGVIRINQCQKEKPIAISSPHFYFAEKEYQDAFVGLKPDKETHQTFIDVEPITGTVISGAKRIQMNMFVEPYKHLDMLKNIKETVYFPMFWVEEGATIDEKNAKEFRDKVTNPQRTGKWASIGVLILGAVILLLVVVVAIFKGCK